MQPMGESRSRESTAKNRPYKQLSEEELKQDLADLRAEYARIKARLCMASVTAIERVRMRRDTAL